MRPAPKPQQATPNLPLDPSINDKIDALVAGIEDEELRSKYSDAINKHNNKMNNMYSDAGF